MRTGRLWAVMPKLRKGEKWAQSLRNDIKDVVGLGWNVCGHFRSEGFHSGVTKLTYRNEAGQRSSVMLPFTWDAASKAKILERVCAIAAVINASPQTDLKAAAQTNRDITENPAATEKPSLKGWDVVREKFLASKAGLRPSTLSDWKLRVERTIYCLEKTTPKPRTGTSVMERFKEEFFVGPNGEESGPNAKMDAGSKGRRRNLKDAASFLTYGVDRCAMPDRYRPPSKSIIEELVGTGEFSAVELLTPALKPEQFTQLLDDLLHEGNQPLWLAVAACGYTGCRPSELATIKVKDGVAKVTSTKRNARNMKKPPKTRSVKPLEIPGRNHEGARVLALIEAGGEMGRFPKALKYQIERVMDPSHENHTTSFRDVGACFNQMLCRSNAWKKLMKDEKNKNLSPYSLRHGFSWRATFGENSMPLRAAADLMGHDLGTHLRWYASWIDEKSSLDAVDRFNAKVSA